jgi:hypothetical protein
MNIRIQGTSFFSKHFFSVTLPSANIAFQQTFQRSICCELPRDLKDITLKPHSRIELSRSSPQLETKGLRRGTRLGARAAF